MHHGSTLGRLVFLGTAFFVATIVTGCATTPSPVSTSPSAQAVDQVESREVPSRFQRPVSQSPEVVTYYPPPGRMDFCGEPVPLDYQEVLERFDREFTLLVYNPAQVYRWLKRMERYSPWIEESLRRLNLPADLKYVAIAESEPPLNAPVKRKSVDMRYDFEVSPDGAFQYLGDLYRYFQSWCLAIAAYQVGEKRIMEQFRAQGEKDCYHMMLPQETERYLFRILAIKAVLSDPKRYGYQLPKGAGKP